MNICDVVCEYKQHKFTGLRKTGDSHEWRQIKEIIDNKPRFNAGLSDELNKYIVPAK